MVIFIYLCILLLNIVAIFMTYKFLGEDFEKKEKKHTFASNVSATRDT